MEYLVSTADRAAFKRCRRQWDFTATTRRSLRPVRAPAPDLDRAMRDALAVYYFPGMWDWDSAIVLPLVAKGLDDSLARQRTEQGDGSSSGDDDGAWEALRELGHSLLGRYVGWAPTVDRFSPIRVATDFDALVADPADPDCGLVGPDGAAIRYTGRIDLLAIDEHDRYWIMSHRVSDRPFPTTEQLLLDEEGVAGCWAWARFYEGMQVAGTIYNELSTSYPRAGWAHHPAARALVEHPRGGIPQNEPSGGGRGVSSLRRIYVKGRGEEVVDRVRQTQGEGFRRTIIRRSTREVSEAGRRIADEAIDMVRDDLRLYPTPVLEHCAQCAFVAPCLAATEGSDVESILTRDYCARPAAGLEIGRLGGTPSGVGRGWVPPPRAQASRVSSTVTNSSPAPAPE